MHKYSDEVKAIYAYISDIMSGRNINIYKVVYGHHLDLYFGTNGAIRIRINNSVVISRYTGMEEVWEMVSSVDLGDPKCFEKVDAAINNAPPTIYD